MPVFTVSKMKLHTPTYEKSAETSAKQERNPKDAFESNGISSFYCWFQELSNNVYYTSHNCNNQSEGHLPDATVDNQLRGFKKINFGQSGKQQKVPV